MALASGCMDQAGGPQERGAFHYHALMNWSALRMLVLLAPWASSTVFAQPPAPPPNSPASASAQALAADPPATLPVNSTMDGRLMYELLLGEFSVLEGAASRGYAIFLDAARRTGEAQLYQRAADVALASRSGDAALQAIQAWVQAFPQSREANRYLLQTLLALNRTSETQQPLQREVQATPLPERPIAIRAIPQLYARSSERALAARVVEAALRESTQSKESSLASAAWVTIGRMRLLAGDSAATLEAAQQAQQIAPAADGPALLALELSSSTERSAAIELLERYLQQPESRPEIRLDYARLLLQNRRPDLAQVQLRQVTEQARPEPSSGSRPGAVSAQSEAWLLLGLIALDQKNAQDGEAALQRYLTLSQQEAPSERHSANQRQAYLALAQSAEESGDFTAAEQWLSHLDAQDPAPDALLRRATLLARQGKLDQALRLIHEALTQAPDAQAAERVRALTEIQMLRNLGQTEQAYARLDQYNQQTLQGEADLLYDQAMMADEIGRNADVEPLLLKVIALSPDNAQAYNALGYFLADRGERLTQARELIQKAMTLTPGDPFITDSMGWLEFRLGNTQKAIQLLQQAYAIRPDSEIATHLGEALWQDGRQDEAREAWRNALRLNAELPALRETLQRLGVGEVK
jgi:tetratricopeptide (TPR) repeat protein